MLRRVTLALLTLAVLTLLISNGVNSQVCTEGMVAYWKFDEGDGTTASDSFGDNHGTIYGSTWTTGQVGDALSFDGSINDYVEGEYTAESSPRIGTVEVWVNAYSYPTRYRYGIIAVGAVGHDRCSLSDIVELDWDGKISYDLWGNECKGPLYRPVSATALNLNEWYHVAVTVDGINAKIYINGTFETSIPSPYGCRSPMYKFIFSKVGVCWSSFYSHDAFHGAMDEVAMYDRALTPGEIQQHYENGLNGLDYCGRLPVTVDIKPGSDPNCFNNDGHGAIPVAILGSAVLDVTQIDASTVELQGMAIKAVGKSNKLLAHIADVNEDGFNDLVVQIEDSDGVFTPGDTTATVTGNLFDGTPFEGADTICIVDNSSPAPPLRTRSKLTTTWAGIKSRH